MLGTLRNTLYAVEGLSQKVEAMQLENAALRARIAKLEAESEWFNQQNELNCAAGGFMGNGQQ